MNKLIILVLPLMVNCQKTTNSEINLSDLVPNSKSTVQIKDSLLKQSVFKDSLKIGNNNNKIKNDTIIKNFQDIVNPFLGKAFEKKDIKYLENIVNKLDSVTKISKADKNYWNAYVYYNMSIISIMNKKVEKSENYIGEAIKLLNSPKTSEDYALLAACKSFSIQFANMMNVPSITQEVQNNAKKSLELNSKNLRAFLVLCSDNFYAPPMFGGMTKVEEYALKGLNCPDTTDKENYYAPGWGRNLLYDYLIKYLKTKKGREQEIKKYQYLLDNMYK
jgi:hypothetical protein